MQFASILFISAAISVSALPAAVDDPAAIETRGNAGPTSVDFACDQSNNILVEQLAEMQKLKTQNISIPPYLAGYYSALNSGRQEIGCPGVLPARKRESTPNKDPCEVTNEQHGRMMALVDRFSKEKIGVAPFLAGFLSGAQDAHKAFDCPPFTTTTTDAADDASASDIAASDDSKTNGGE